MKKYGIIAIVIIVLILLWLILGESGVGLFIK